MEGADAEAAPASPPLLLLQHTARITTHDTLFSASGTQKRRPAPLPGMRCGASARLLLLRRASAPRKPPPPPINTGMAAWQGGMQFHWAYLGPSANEHCASAVMQHGQGAQWRTSSASRVQGHSDQGASAHQRREMRGTISLLLRAADGRALGCLAGHYWSCWLLGRWSSVAAGLRLNQGPPSLLRGSPGRRSGNLSHPELRLWLVVGQTSSPRWPIPASPFDPRPPPPRAHPPPRPTPLYEAHLPVSPGGFRFRSPEAEAHGFNVRHERTGADCHGFFSWCIERTSS
jgi:hypothetical protein